MYKLLLIFLLLVTSLYSGEIEERNTIKQRIKILFQKEKYEEITKLANHYLKTEERTSGGRWKLRFLYSGTYQLVDNDIKDMEYWDKEEKKFLDWIKKQPNEPTPHIAYTQFLITKGWMYRGNSYAKSVPTKNWKLFKDYVHRATKYLIKHKDVASKNPHWYTVMLNLAKLNSSNKIVFNLLLNEALEKFPNYYSIYEYALYYMHPKWNHFSVEDIEKVAQKVLYITKDKDGAYARFYWMAKDIMKDSIVISNLDIDWELMKQSMKKLISKYPTAYNINGFAYLSCLVNRQETSIELYNKILDKPILNQRKNKEHFRQCTAKRQDISILTIKPTQLITYLENYNGNKPLYIYFSSYKKEDIVKNIDKIEQLSKEYTDEFDFLSVNFNPYKNTDYPELYKKFYLKNLPLSVIVYKNKIILRIKESQSVKTYEKEMIQVYVDNILKEMEYINFIKYFKESIVDESSFINTEENIRLNIYDYLKAKGTYSAYAVASSMKKDTWASGRSLSATSQDEANTNAMQDCKKERKKFNISNQCKLFMIGNKYVFDENHTFIVEQKAIQNMTNIDVKKYKFHSPMSLERINEKYNMLQLYKAWAVNEYSRVSIFHKLSVGGHNTQEEANLDALNRCEKTRIESNVARECILYMAGDKYVYTQNITKSKMKSLMEEKINAMSIFKTPAKKITINNKGTPFGILETIDFEININDDIIEANMIGGVLKGKDLENYTKTYLPEMYLCIGKDITKRWHIETCSEPYPINEYMTRNKIIPLKKHKFIIPRNTIGKELNKKWFILKIVSKIKRRGYVYAHHRRDTLDKFLDK